MLELQRWLDAAPTIRTAVVSFDGWKWHATVGIKLMDGTEKCGDGEGDSLTFAVVAAILDQRKE
jgi:hypothetical protein